jgi:hypothetical protein
MPFGENAKEREENIRDGYWRYMSTVGSQITRYDEPEKHERAVEILKLALSASSRT